MPNPDAKMNSRPVRRALIAGAFLGSMLASLLVCSTALAVWEKIAAAGPQTLSTTTLGAPTSLTASALGQDVSLTWTAGTNGTGYLVRGLANGSSSDCSGVSYAAVGTASVTSYSDSGRYSPQGSYFCYQVLTSRGNWTSVAANPTAAVQIGFVIVSASVSNGGTAARLDAGDVFTFTFNQPVATSSGPATGNSICSTNAGTIMIGLTATAGSCSTAETTALGRLTGGTTSANGRFATTWVWSNGNRTLTATIGSRQAGSYPSTSGSWTLTPTTTSTKLLSATGSFHVCDSNSGGGNCLPALSGSF